MKEQFAKIFEYDDIGQVLVWYEYSYDTIHFILTHNGLQAIVKMKPNQNTPDDEKEKWCEKTFASADKEKTYAAVLSVYQDLIALPNE